MVALVFFTKFRAIDRMLFSSEMGRTGISCMRSSGALVSADGSRSRIRDYWRSALSRLVVQPAAVATGEGCREPGGVNGFPGIDALAAPLPYEREACAGTSALGLRVGLKRPVIVKGDHGEGSIEI